MTAMFELAVKNQGLKTNCFYSASAMQSAVLAIVNPSLCLSVRHTPALCQNDSSYDHAVFTVG